MIINATVLTQLNIELRELFGLMYSTNKLYQTTVQSNLN